MKQAVEELCMQMKRYAVSVQTLTGVQIHTYEIGTADALEPGGGTSLACAVEERARFGVAYL